MGSLSQHFLGILQISDGRGSIVNQVMHKLLQSGDSAQKYMQGSRSMKIDNWILLDNLVQGRSASLGARTKALRTHSKRSKKHMSMKQQKKCGSLDLPQEFHKWVQCFSTKNFVSSLCFFPVWIGCLVGLFLNLKFWIFNSILYLALWIIPRLIRQFFGQTMKTAKT